MMNRITCEVEEVIASKFNKINIDFNEELLGNKVKLAPVDLAILLKELEKKYKISFNKRDIIEGRFNNIYNISMLIKKEIEN